MLEVGIDDLDQDCVCSAIRDAVLCFACLF